MLHIYIVPTSAERFHESQLLRVHVHLVEKVSAVTQFHLTANVKENTVLQKHLSKQSSIDFICTWAEPPLILQTHHLENSLRL